MSWVVLALAAAAAAAGREALTKSVMRDGDAVPVGFLILAGTAALLLVPALASGAAVGDPAFWWALAVSGGVNAAAAVMISRAVHVSDLSLVSPLQATTPLFMVGTGWVFLGELPDPAGLSGIAVLVFGAWVLNSRRGGGGLLDPFRALARDAGARLFLGVAFLFAVSGAVDKVGVGASGTLLWPAATNAVGAALLLPVLSRGHGWRRVRRLLGAAPLRLAAAAAAMSLGIAAQMAALPLTLAAYVIAVKRTSILISVVAGGVLFREPALGRRLAGAAIMVAGLILLAVGRAQ